MLDDLKYNEYIIYQQDYLMYVEEILGLSSIILKAIFMI